MDHACFDIREGKLNRKEAIELVIKYDGKCSDEYIDEFCNYVDITPDEFWNTAERFRGDMWKKEGEEWKNRIWMELKKQL